MPPKRVPKGYPRPKRSPPTPGIPMGRSNSLPSFKKKKKMVAKRKAPPVPGQGEAYRRTISRFDSAGGLAPPGSPRRTGTIRRPTSKSGSFEDGSVKLPNSGPPEFHFVMTRSNLEEAKKQQKEINIADWKSQDSDDSSLSLGSQQESGLNLRQGFQPNQVLGDNMGASFVSKSNIVVDGKSMDALEIQEIAKELNIMKSDVVTFNKKVTNDNVGLLSSLNPKISDLTIMPESKITTAMIPTIMKNLPELFSLDISGCKTLFTSWDKLKNEDEAVFKEEMKLQQAGIKAIAKHPKLAKILLRNMQFLSEKAISILLDSKTIQFMDFSYCTHLTDSHMSKAGTNSVIVVNYTNVSDKGLKKLQSSGKNTIQGLSVRGCDKLTAKSVFTFAEFGALKELDISANMNLNANFSSFQNIQNLESINISNIPILDSDLVVFSRVPSLRTLVMEGCANITSNGLQAAATSGLNNFLIELNVQGCPKVDSLIFLQNFMSLRSLNIKKIKIPVVDFSRYIQMCHLEQIFASFLTNAHLKAVSKLPLSHLEAESSPEVTDEGFRHIALNNRLVWVKIDTEGISRTALTNFEGIRVMNFAVMKFISENNNGYLDLSNNDLLDPLIVSNITFFRYIKVLDLSNCYLVNDDVIRTFASNPKIKSVKKINILGTQVTRNVFRGNRVPIPHSLLRAVVNHTNSLDFTDSSVADDALVAELLKWPNLNWLNLTGCKKVTDETVRLLLGLADKDFHLKMISIFNTSISGNSVKEVLATTKKRVNIVLLRSFVSTGMLDIMHLPYLDTGLFEDIIFNCYLPTIDMRKIPTKLRSSLSPLHITNTVQHLNLSGLKEIQDADMATLFGAKGPRLITLYIDRCVNIGNKGIIEISNSVTLMNLSLRAVPKVTDYGAKYLARIPTLAQLTITDNKNIGNETIRSISYCKKLTKVSFEGTGMDEMCFHEPLQFDPANAVLDEYVCRFKTLKFNSWTIDFDQMFEFTVGNPYIKQVAMTNCPQLSDYFIGKIISSFPNLEEVDLSGCTNVTKISLPKKTMNTLKLRGCWSINNVQHGVSRLFSMSNLFYIDLDDIGFDSAQLFQAVHPNITTLLARGCVMRHQDMKIFGKFFPNLETLDISKIDSPAGSYFPNLQSMRSLKSLYLNQTSIGDADFEAMTVGNTDIPLTHLYLDRAAISYSSLVKIKEKILNLKHLSIQEYNDVERLPGKLFRTWELESIDLSNTRGLTDAKMEEFVKFQKDSGYSVTEIIAEECNRVTKTFSELMGRS